MAEEAASTATSETAAFLATARKRFQMCVAAEATLRQEMLDDKRFRKGEQWPDNLRAARELDKRPCLTIDKLSGPIRQITNIQRQSRFAIDVIPAHGPASQETAEVIQGLIRQIEVSSSAQVAYAWAFEDAVSCGRGYWRILTDYAGDDTWDQELKIRRVLDPLTVYMDPSAQEPDGSDARFAFIVEDVPRDEFTERYPKAEPASLEAFESVTDRSPDWFPEGKVRVAEYWYREPRTRRMAQLVDGSVQEVAEDFEGEEIDGLPIIDRRDVDAYSVKWALITAAGILEQRDWPGKYLPIVPVLGEELNTAGQRDVRGLVRSSRDAQRMYNYWVSAETEMIALAPRAPFVGVEGQFEGHEHEWKQANVRNFPYLEYKGTSIAGHPVGPPQRQAYEPPIQAIVMAIQQADGDIKATTGLFDPSLGNISSRERSGRAIMALQKQGETANSNYVDNLARAITHTGRILLDLLPAIYDRPGRLARILGTDDTQQTVALNAPFVPGPNGQPQPVPPGMPAPPQAKTFDLRQGRYTVEVQVGPSFTTRRQESVAAMTELLSAYPAAFPMVGDLVIAEMDWPGAKPISERLKKMLPQQLQEQGPEAQIPPQVQAQMQQAMQMVEMLTQRVNQLTEQIQTETVKAERDALIKQMELASRERVAAMQVQADLVKTEATINAQAAQTLLAEQVASIRHMLELQHDRESQREQAILSEESAAAQRDYEAQQAEAERAAEEREEPESAE